MNAYTLNLLRYPRRANGVDGLQACGGLVGLVLGLSLAALLHWQHTALLQQQQHWTHLLAVQAQQQSRQRAARAQDQVQAEQQVLWRSVQFQEQQRRDLQTALQREAELGLRLSRWQADGHNLWLQGQLPQTDDLPGLQTRLGKVLGQPWTLHSLDATGTAGVWTLQAPWPAASNPKGAP